MKVRKGFDTYFNFNHLRMYMKHMRKHARSNIITYVFSIYVHLYVTVVYTYKKILSICLFLNIVFSIDYIIE
jgi:hypothetical protein